MTCGAKYQAGVLRGLAKISANEDLAPALTFGHMVHAGFEAWAKEAWRQDDPDCLHKAAISAVLAACPPNWRHRDQKRTLWNALRVVHEGIPQLEAPGAPKTLIGPNGLPCAELPLRFPCPGHNPGQTLVLGGEDIWLCGRLDRIVQWEGQLWAADFKTTDYTVTDYSLARYEPDVQFTLYPALARWASYRVEGVLAEIFTLPAFDEPLAPCYRHPETRQESEVAEFLDEVREAIEQAYFWAVRGKWPMRRTSCMAHGRPCEYQSDCCEPPDMRTWSGYGVRHFDPLA